MKFSLQNKSRQMRTDLKSLSVKVCFCYELWNKSDRDNQYQLVQNDFQAFLATRNWCLMITLARSVPVLSEVLW